MENRGNELSNRDKIAKRLKEARVKSGLSQDQAARLLNINRPTISEIEAGRRKVSAEELIQFAELYQVDSSWLLHDSNDSNIMFAARELGKLSENDIKKVIDILKILPK
jgi:transcriptional regulator with XRE-family HTH domain